MMEIVMLIDEDIKVTRAVIIDMNDQQYESFKLKTDDFDDNLKRFVEAIIKYDVDHVHICGLNGSHRTFDYLHSALDNAGKIMLTDGHVINKPVKHAEFPERGYFFVNCDGVRLINPVVKSGLKKGDLVEIIGSAEANKYYGWSFELMEDPRLFNDTEVVRMKLKNPFGLTIPRDFKKEYPAYCTDFLKRIF